MKILDLFGKKDASSEINKTMPYRIIAEPVLGSVVVELPKLLSLDDAGMSTAKELRLGTISPGEEKAQQVEIHGDAGTDKGEYTLSITAFIHYRDYGHVLNAVKKKAVLEVA